MTTIIRIPFLGALLLAFLPACNNNNEEPVTKKEDIPVQEKEMKDAIAKYPDSMLLRENLIQYYQDNGTTDLALAETNTALQKDSTDTRLWDKKAELHIEQADTAGAIKAYEKAIEIFPEPQFIMSLGWLYAQTKDTNAIVMADALLMGKNARADKEALLIKGLYFSATGNKQKALGYFDNCLALDYTFMLAYREKAIVLYDMAKYEEALTILDKAVTLQNKFDEGYYWMGRCFEKLNKTNDAIESYRSAVLYNPDYIEAKDALARLGVK
ncbi:tetratricopeptide repeat protein [Ferruginibacter sp.]|nr:tetratricopeptide repeat protein [Ferruginibacter sp.]